MGDRPFLLLRREIAGLTLQSRAARRTAKVQAEDSKCTVKVAASPWILRSHGERRNHGAKGAIPRGSSKLQGDRACFAMKRLRSRCGAEIRGAAVNFAAAEPRRRRSRALLPLGARYSDVA